MDCSLTKSILSRKVLEYHTSQALEIKQKTYQLIGLLHKFLEYYTFQTLNTGKE
jgi:hypothetical protein